MTDNPLSHRDVTRQLGYQLRIAQGAVWRDLVATFEPFGIKPQQYAAMARIEQSPDITLEVLAQALGMRSPNLVGVVEELVSRGLVTRRKLSSDRRVNALYLSPAGSALLQTLKAADDRHEAALVTMFGSGRVRRLLSDLRKLTGFTSTPPVAGRSSGGDERAADGRFRAVEREALEPAPPADRSTNCSEPSVE